ncbi:hypothetical protein ISU02_19755 [Fusibacter sp. Q10-2]|uniref:Uncharacterized protein n=2 Tax=Fusibacter ferrireducens TaxID=2785058 RepID=A0ABR9ZXZ8_9FIRM|nr:hypothetical protein [Fusibacter ferrireducens]
MRINSKVVGLLSLGIMFGGIAIFMGLGIWKTESTKIPAKYSSGIYEGEANPADIRGSYTFAEVAEAFDVPVEILKEAFLIPSEVEADKIQNKDLEGMYVFEDGTEIGNGSVKLFVALYKGLPYALSDDYVFDKAVPLIRSNQPELSPEIEAYLVDHTVPSEVVEANVNPVDSNEVSTGETTSEEENFIKGNTTFQQVLDMGVTVEEVEAIIEADLPQKSMTVKDYCLKESLEFSTVKAALQNLIE